MRDLMGEIGTSSIYFLSDSILSEAKKDRFSIEFFNGVRDRAYLLKMR